MAGTQAATDILFSREEMRPVLEKAAVGNGKLKPFELLIETRSFGSSSPQANIIAAESTRTPDCIISPKTGKAPKMPRYL
jgi:hypothetical protein